MKNPMFSNVAAVLLLVGGINLGLIGLFQIDLITSILGDALGRILFVIIGISAIFRIFEWSRGKGR
jgi:uncharacterized protein